MTPGLRRILSFLMPFAALAALLALRVTGAGNIAPTTRANFLSLLHTYLPGFADSLAHPAYSNQAELLFLGAVGLGIAALVGRGKTIWAAALSLAGIGAAALLFWGLAQEARIFFDPSFIIVSLVCIAAVGIFGYSLLGARERARLRFSLAKHLSPEAMAQIIHRPELLNLKGEARSMTYLVCMVRRFGPLAESFISDPEEFSRLMRRVMTPLSQSVLGRSGAVDSIAPGQISAFFNAPLDDAQHAVHACECALRMTEEMEKVNRALEQERRADGTAYAPIEIGIGINTGPGVAGDFGPYGRTEYTVTGRAALIAAEIARMSGKYGPAIIVGETTRAAAERNFAFLEADLVALPRTGTTDPTPVFVLLGNPLVRASPKFRALHTFHEHIFQAYRAQNWEKAKGLIEQCQQLSGASPLLYALYLERIAYLEKHPPGEGWNGVFPVAVS